ncbi:RNA polymerase sigma factor FliA [Pseudidiomarina insulisalsae]|uniref:RNA polymerase sigma factor FliA n=1 Tax=Pseudidiomarina insulisalsae TaxID=575789 RepID=A0A432YDT2_9GAMM|nr:RNA polymerase sigma factor FliA [Pseudidiomarina insulisalsae]RUO59073.1 RNA polymerase sigma factor FliA [Pseudidiomarina insulisalsae]
MYTAAGTLDKQDILEHYYPLVRKIALALKVKLPASVDIEDLVQAGVEGLLMCVERFNAQAGVNFSTYAHQRIRGAMIDELRSRDWLPRSVRRSGRELESCMRRLEQQLGRAPEERELAQAMSLSLEEYRQLLADTNSGLLMSFDELHSDDSESVQFSDNSQQPETQVQGHDLKQRVQAAIASLPEREQVVMTLYYQEELNLKEIGAVLDVTESRISQLHSQAIKRIRARIG